MGAWPFGASPPRDSDRNKAPPAAPPPSTTPSPPGDDDDDDENPFIIFRRAVDDQFRLMAAGLSSIPSILHELQARGESETSSRPEEGNSKDSRWSHRSFADRAEQPLAFMSQHFEPPHWGGGWRRGPPPSDEALAAARTLLLQSREACALAGVSPMDILRLYRDPESTHHFFGHYEPAWLSVQWFHSSPYSPAQLETHTQAHQYGSMWRAAFEDLLSTSTGREPVARDAWTGKRQDQKLYHSWAQTPRDWMLGLQCRGVLPPQLPALYRLNSTKHMDHIFSGLMRGVSGRELGPWGHPAKKDLYSLAREIGTFDADEQPQCTQKPSQVRMQVEKPAKIAPVAPAKEKTTQIPPVAPTKESVADTTELDAYEHFLGRASAEMSSQHAELIAPAPIENKSAEHAQPVSTLSTTERTTHPDGSVTTKVVVRKVFADGSEQELRSESMTLGQTRDASPSGQTKEDKAKETKEQKKGWFWK